MFSDNFLKSLVILKDTQAAALTFNNGGPLPVWLVKGKRFDAVTAYEEEGENAFFHDIESGLTFICPCDNVFLLSGRFGKCPS